VVWLTDPAVPAEGREHDRELQALAAVHGDHLHRRCVGLQPAAALFDLRPGVADPALQPFDERRRAQLLGRSRAVEGFPDVAQVGQLPFTVGCAEQTLEQASFRDDLEQRRHTTPVEHRRPTPPAGGRAPPLRPLRPSASLAASQPTKQPRAAVWARA
jgi:hypothetical protein